MATFTHNHLMVSTNWACTSGPWIGETSSWTMRFDVANARRPLDSGQVGLNGFDAHTDLSSRALTISTVAGTVAATWVGDDLPGNEFVTANDQDFLLQTVGTFAKTVSAYLPASYKIVNLKLYAVNELGKAPLGPTTWTPTTAYAGTAGGALSPEVSLCVSFYTAHRAKAGRGRIYMGPVKVSSLTTDGLFDTAMTGPIGDAMKTCQDAIRTRGTPGSSAVYHGIVWNRHPPGQEVGPGTTGCVINKIRIGDEPDHQERRTKTRSETFLERSVA